MVNQTGNDNEAIILIKLSLLKGQHRIVQSETESRVTGVPNLVIVNKDGIRD
jgi:hypothetical protein